MSNLSIQKMLGTVATDTASSPAGPAQGTRLSRNAPDLRDPAQAFNEVMQRHTASSPTRDSVRDSAREPVREPVRDSTRAPERNARPSNDSPRPAQASGSDASNANNRNDRTAQDSTRDADAAGPAAEASTANTKATQNAKEGSKAAPNRKDKDATTDEDADPNTRTGDLFANLGLTPPALGGASALQTPADAAAAQAAGQSAQGLAKLPVPAAAAALSGHDKAGTLEGRIELSAGLATGGAAHLAELAGANKADAKSEGKTPGHTATPPTALPLADTPAEASAARGVEVLAGLASAAQAHEPTGARAERVERAERIEGAGGNPLSLSAALSGATHALSPLSNTGSTLYSIAHAQVKTALGAYGFADDFSQRVVMLAGQRVQSAEIAITPADLGPISVTMEMRGQEASLVFGATQTATRAALEDALPRLREMFQAQGLHLVDAHVGAQLNHQGQRQGQHTGSSERRSAGPATEAIGAVSQRGHNAQAALNTVAPTVTVSNGVRLIDVRV